MSAQNNINQPTTLLTRLRLSPPEPLSAGQLQILLLLGFSVAVGRYDSELLSLVIPFVQADLGMEDHMVANLVGLSKLGVIAGLFLGILADRFGRIRLLGFTIFGLSLATAATAFAQTPAQFVAAQFWARAFVDAESGLVVIFAVEILASRNRGWVLGVGAAFAALGSGVAAIAFALIDDLPGGWRALYIASLSGIFLVAYMRRRIPETTRFTHATQASTDAGIEPRLIAPVIALFQSSYRHRLVTLSLVQSIFGFGVASAFALQSKHLIENHGFEPAEITILFILGGALAIFGNLAGGLLADRFGRKPILGMFLVLTSLGIVGFYLGKGTAVVAFWILYAFSQFAVGIILTAYEAELFPTRQRATAGSVISIAATLGFATGAFSEGHLYTLTGNHQIAVAMLALSLPIAYFVIGRSLPETANRDLDDVSPDPDHKLKGPGKSIQVEEQLA